MATKRRDTEADIGGEGEQVPLMDEEEQKQVIENLHRDLVKWIGTTRWALMVMSILFCLIWSTLFLGMEWSWEVWEHLDPDFHFHPQILITSEAFAILATACCTIACLRNDLQGNYKNWFLIVGGVACLVPFIYFSATIPREKYMASPICLYFPLSAPFAVSIAFYIEHSLVQGRKEIDELKSLTYSFQKP